MTLNYVKYGNPNNNYLPKWDPFTIDAHKTMIIDRECACLEAYDEELVELFDQVNPKFSFNFD